METGSNYIKYIERLPKTTTATSNSHKSMIVHVSIRKVATLQLFNDILLVAWFGLISLLIIWPYFFIANQATDLTEYKSKKENKRALLLEILLKLSITLGSASN